MQGIPTPAVVVRPLSAGRHRDIKHGKAQFRRADDYRILFGYSRVSRIVGARRFGKCFISRAPTYISERRLKLRDTPFPE
jgi:hypothetical protein